MSWISNLFREKKVDKNENVVDDKIAIEKKTDGIVLEGKGSSKKVIQDVHKEQRDKLLEWRERYSKEEYPYKIVINIIYQSLQLEFMWSELHKCFSPNIRKIDDYKVAYNFVMNLKEVAILNIRSKVEQTYNSRELIGNFDISLFKKIVSDAQNGNNEQMEKIEKSYLWYTGGVELMYHWAACGLMGLNYSQSASEVCSLVMGVEYKNLSDMQTMFGNNINLEYKSLPHFYDKNDHNKKETIKYFEQDADEAIRFLNGNIELVENKFDGIWMKPVSEILVDDELMVAFMPDFVIEFPTLKSGIPATNKKTIEFAHKLSQGAHYKFDNYVYPDFGVLIKEKNKDVNRLTDEMKNQIFHLVSFIINQYFMIRILQQKDSKGNLTFDHLLVSIVNLLYKKDSVFDRINFYYNTQFYLHPIEDAFSEKIIHKAQLDYKTLKENKRGVYKPYGYRDEEELILSYIDAIVIREFLLNHFKSRNETMSYFNFIPDLVEDLYANKMASNNQKIKNNYDDDDDDDDLLV